MEKIRKLLGRKIYESQLILVDGWTFLHVAIFFGIGIYYPNRWALVITGMVIFEAIESRVSKKVKFLKENKKDTFSDFAFNLLGYWLAQIFPII